MGLELLIENGQVDWGFCWDNENIDFYPYGRNWNPNKDNNTIPPGQRDAMEGALVAAGLDLATLKDPNSYIQLQPSKQGSWYIRISLGNIGNIEIADSADNGLSNTEQIYNWKGISALASVLQILSTPGVVANPETATNAGLENSLDYAVMYALKRNRFIYYTGISTGTENKEESTVEVHVPVLEAKDLNWYLPAKSQFKQIIDLNANWGQQFTFNDSYWTSTAFLEQDGSGSKSYSYNNMVETVSPRTERYLTMAVRQYTVEANVEIGGNTVSPGSGGENNSGNEKPGSGDNAGDIGGGTGN